MTILRRQFLHLAAGAACCRWPRAMASAQTYPTRPVRIIVPVPPGGALDIIARLMGQWLSERLGQSFVIENRPGGGTNIGVEAVVHAHAGWLHAAAGSRLGDRQRDAVPETATSISSATSCRSR